MRERRAVGGSGLEVSPLCLGGNVFGWSADEEASFAVLDAYVEAGGNFVDTANVYSAWAPGNQGGESEAIVGRWQSSRGRRDEVVIATKVGMAGGPSQPKGLTRDKIRRGVEDSLARLRTDRIDLYWAHQDDAETPLQETLAAFGELVAEGSVRAIGASNYSAERLREALEVSSRDGLVRYEALQPAYNLMERRRFENGLSAIATAAGLGVTPYYALARGFLTGKYRPDGALPSSPRAAGIARDYLNDRGWGVLAALDEIAAAHGATDGQVALAWLMAQPAVVAPIASATTPDQVRDLAGAAELRLTTEELGRLSDASGG